MGDLVGTKKQHAVPVDREVLRPATAAEFATSPRRAQHDVEAPVHSAVHRVQVNGHALTNTVPDEVQVDGEPRATGEDRQLLIAAALAAWLPAGECESHGDSRCVTTPLDAIAGIRWASRFIEALTAHPSPIAVPPR